METAFHVRPNWTHVGACPPSELRILTWPIRCHIVQTFSCRNSEPVRTEFKPSLSTASPCHPKQRRNAGYAYNRESQLEAHRIWMQLPKQFSLARRIWLALRPTMWCCFLCLGQGAQGAVSAWSSWAQLTCPSLYENGFLSPIQVVYPCLHAFLHTEENLFHLWSELARALSSS